MILVRFVSSTRPSSIQVCGKYSIREPGGFWYSAANYMGLRLDYIVNKKLSLGGTVVKLGERPFFVKQSYGDDPSP